jgi:hypothetical protein
MARKFLDPLALALPIALGLTVTLVVIGSGAGPGWLRPLCCSRIGLTASLAVAAYRSTLLTIVLTPAGIAVALRAGLLPADITAVDITPCPQGDVITVRHRDGGVGRFFVDPVARVYAIPGSCPTAAAFVERYPSVEARGAFAIETGAGR